MKLWIKCDGDEIDMKNYDARLHEIKIIYSRLTIENKWKLLLLAKDIKNIQEDKNKRIMK